jgi:uncharacterized protein (TIGR02466 family)
MADLIPLFCKPVYVNHVPQLNFDISNVEWIQNYTNFTSKSRNILPEIANVETIQLIYQTLSEYFYGLLGVNESTELYITESWLNKNTSGQHHHRHWHPNSIISAVICLSAVEDSGALTFITSAYETMEFEVAHANVYNSKSWSCNLKPNDIVLFPSSVEHLVEKNNSQAERITLSFNTFVKGKINTLPYTSLVI